MRLNVNTWTFSLDIRPPFVYHMVSGISQQRKGSGPRALSKEDHLPMVVAIIVAWFAAGMAFIIALSAPEPKRLTQ